VLRRCVLLRGAPPSACLSAIGEPVMVDTSQDSRLGRIFMNRTIKVYTPNSRISSFGMEETIERIVGFFPARGSGARGAQADPLSVGSGRRRQVLTRRTAEAADGERAGLCPKGWQRSQSGF